MQKPDIFYCMQKVALLCLLLLTAPLFAFDHTYSGYASVLKTFAKGGGVRYGALQKNRKGLDQFIAEIGGVNKTEYGTWSREQQLAFWINAYNAWMIHIVIDHYPITRNGLTGLMFPESSVQQVDGIWDNYRLQSPAGKVSLNGIEQRILRGEFKEPKIHFAIVCASAGCPVLRDEPYLPSRLSEQLDDAVSKFVWNSSKVRLDEAARKIDISQIFQWFAEDFRGFADDQWKHEYAVEKAGPLAFIGSYLPPGETLFLKTGPVDVSYFPYDWSLNETN